MRCDKAAAVAVGVAALCVGALVWLAGDVHAALGDTDPGRPASLVFGAVRLVADAAGAVAVGSLAFAAFVVPARWRRGLSADAYAAVRLASAAAGVWAVAAATAVPLSAGDASGQPPSVAWSHLADLVAATEEPKAWLVVAVVAAVVALGARSTLTWPVTVLWLSVSVPGLLAPAIAGHVSVGAWHDVATDAIVWHVPAAAVWVGALVALRAFLRRPSSEHRERVLRRYRGLTLGCLVVAVVSGSVAGLVVAGPGGLWSGYGALLAVKLAVCGAVPALRRWWGATRPLAAEVGALGVALGASVGATHLVPPSWLVERPSVQETVLGYELPAPPSAAGLLLGWRPDLLFGLGAVLLAAAYLAGARRLRRRGDRWPAGRTVAWTAGCAVVLVVTSSGLGRYAAGTFSAHMVAHMASTMLAPVLLVLGGPVTLALRALPPGPRDLLLALVHCRATRVVAHPAVAASVFVASFYALYFSGLFGEAMRYHWAHQAMNLHFLVSGYVFYWLVVGVDRAPRPLPHLARLGLLFAVMPFHAFFGVTLMNTQAVIAETFYRQLSLSWVPDLLTDQRLGGGIAWATGEVPMLVVVIALLHQWAAADRREATRLDRRLDGDEDERLAAYNAMLADLAGRRT
ncbi:cytochrome c oxidase assembly protein [Saccharothrix australiensis]|uniref:Putative copper resistance protein D n=1 Tax=Saccharothrix australiensis TaxID=2072 RepID=A0A495W187_9PSEU|nr:cytochrome c oxidase assembly protein [Saccharothrix australiensis]RKT55164.1 putative copper resistance protein D [Saccharothrix australiensis]